MADEFDEADFFAAEAAAQRPAQPTRAATPNTSTATGGASKVVQPRPQALPQRQGPSAILVSTRQKGNPILKHVTSVPWEWAEIPCDYVLGATTCALFLSLKYHRLHPEYIYGRIRQLGKLYNLRILLTMVDITNHEEALKELSKTSMINNLTLILCWSSQEAGRYLELYKSYEHASAASIRAHQAETYQESLTEFVTTPRNINKTDAASLISNFGSLRNAINAQPEELALVPGWGEKKIRAWVTTVREPFRVRRAAKSSAALLREESTLGGSDGSGTNTPAERSDGGAHTPIPIGRVSTVSRQGSNVVVTSKDAAEEAGPSQKRPRLEAVHVDNFETDEEAALLALAEEETKMTDAEKPKAAQAVTRKEPELSEGVMAALAKLREQG
ncbi:ssDNA endonuclease and repair protein rad10 [Exophiala dermatitidis]|uniref:DNA excision repair protein ERCC-1 n=2 Tax=Exophiala dermatitidis TaxID=5970 RepID=H6BUE8_EXODN|nr:DNA excision repair protein ERCC-1 [Exophiala dermatitidis NIH/UT8656]KAJ4506579.1 ssDNA endonuclease and repair protein rad10 [Exophiala dermatitidis]EHY55690.1 DNA excision repair protein ERCC-1 [Exophiala dermatitidis NIH/UT8656]KAJ4508848.1 ssDNA endonuclease and repair protein rad10 [Exophiala dermatitidis]KAJ4510100.1 ssDNA endonuclease and repair protein rad10 [Exophiala dermatitidis]KAJ4539103.1 ssDNA endonuclease and repair protein rad10 [Exophiala dermatitidis]